MVQDPYLNHLIIAGLIIAGAAVLGRLLKAIIGALFHKISERTKTTLDDRILAVIREKVTILTVIVGIDIAIDEVRKGLTADDVTHIQILEYLDIAIFVLVVYIITRLVARIVRTTLTWYMDEVSSKTQSNLSTITPMAMKIINIVLFLMAAMIVLDHFEINIGSLLVSLGVASLAIALAAQDTLANMIGGFVILVDRPFRIGDRIQIPSGEVGEVHEIGLRSTKILLLDNNSLIVPNAELIKNRILNFNYPNAIVRVIVEVGVAYGSEVDRVKYILLDVANNHPDLLRDPAPVVFLVGFGDSSLNFRLIGTTNDYRTRFAIEADLRERILEAFAEEGVEIPFPQRVIRTVGSNATETSQAK